MTKIRLLIGGLLFIAILLVVGFLYLPKKSVPTPSNTVTPTPVEPLFPVTHPTTAPIPTGNTITIDGVTTDNFYQSTTPFDPEGDRALADKDEYRIVYLPGSNQFLVTITGPFDTTRGIAEQNILTLLHISPEEACRLNIIVQTPSFANPDQAGQDFPLSFCALLPSPTQGKQVFPTPIKQITYKTIQSLDIAIGNPPQDAGGSGGIPVPSGSLGGLVNAVNQILTCEGGGAHAPYPSCVRNLNIPQSFKNNLNATYPNFQCGQFIWSAQHLLGWPVFPGNVGSVFQWYSMNSGHRQAGYSFICNPYRVGGCTTSKINQAGGAIAPGDIIIYGSTGRSDPGHIATVVTVQGNEFTIRVVEANYRHGVTWFRWTNLNDNLGRGANILGWWRKQ